MHLKYSEKRRVILVFKSHLKEHYFFV